MNAVSQARKKLHQAKESAHKNVKGVGQSEDSIVMSQDKSFRKLETFAVLFPFCVQI